MCFSDEGKIKHTIRQASIQGILCAPFKFGLILCNSKNVLSEKNRSEQQLCASFSCTLCSLATLSDDTISPFNCSASLFPNLNTKDWLPPCIHLLELHSGVDTRACWKNIRLILATDVRHDMEAEVPPRHETCIGLLRQPQDSLHSHRKQGLILALVALS